MFHTPFNFESHVQYAIDRIAADRELTLPVGTGAPGTIESMRQRIGSVLITIGERVGGPAVRTPPPMSPRPNQTPLLSF